MSSFIAYGLIPNIGYSQDKPSGESTSLPELIIDCIFLPPHRQLVTPSGGGSKNGLGIGNTVLKPKPPIRSCEAAKALSPDTLVGAGHLAVIMQKKSYTYAVEHQRAKPEFITLYINGVAMGSDAELLSIEETSENALLLWRIKPGKESQKLWAKLYQNGGLTDPQYLSVALGWSTSGPGISTLNPNWKIQITDFQSQIIALILLSFFSIGFLMLAKNTDVLRDTSLPGWYQEAEALRMKLSGKGIADVITTLKGYSATFKPEDNNLYRQAANFALEGKPVPDDKIPTIIGLSLLEREWQPVPAAFSLARVQLGVWFLFAVATGVFLWVIYGQLPRLDGSTLALLGLSVATTGMSFAVDRNAGGRPYTPTQGFWVDITTGFDEKQQIHRYQAVVVNILLLVVGIWHVLHQLTYPVFDDTWLAFLGVSGVALAMGKTTENKNPAPGAQQSQIPTPSSQSGSNQPGNEAVG